VQPLATIDGAIFPLAVIYRRPARKAAILSLFCNNYNVFHDSEQFVKFFYPAFLSQQTPFTQSFFKTNRKIIAIVP
jgi:hypothetical protein